MAPQKILYWFASMRRYMFPRACKEHVGSSRGKTSPTMKRKTTIGT
jgi:hypothetical protein